MKTKIFLISALITVNQCWGTCGNNARYVNERDNNSECHVDSQCNAGRYCSVNDVAKAGDCRNCPKPIVEYTSNSR